VKIGAIPIEDMTQQDLRIPSRVFDACAGKPLCDLLQGLPERS
jgi:hypothetical protein